MARKYAFADGKYRKHIRMFILGSPRNLNDLVLLRPAVLSRRKEAEILVIDDQGFGYNDFLLSHHFHVQTLSDIEDVRSVAEYHVIACDIKGVGKRFKSKYEGAHVIAEIHKAYPHKILIGYSTHSFDASYNQYLKLCDDVVIKDMDSDGWLHVLDEATTKAVDPQFQWKRMRDYLLAKEVPLLTILRLQEDYIAALVEKNRDKFPRSGTLNTLPPDLRAVLQGFAGNLLFKVVFS